MPVFMKLRFLTVTNPAEVSNGAKPKLKELGPFAYRETREKRNILEVDGDKIHYASYMDYTFDEVELIVMNFNKMPVGHSAMDKALTCLSHRWPEFEPGRVQTYFQS